MIRDEEAEDDTAPAPEGGSTRAKLKLAAHYAMLAFAPVVSIAALGIALLASDKHPDRAQSGELNSVIDNLNASLMATKSEIDNLKFSIAREKSQRADEKKNSDEIDARIVRNVTQLQMKLKISPTLEEQLRAAASARAAASVAANASAVSAPAAASAPGVAGKMQSASAPLPANAAGKPAAVNVTKEAAQKPAAAAPAPKADDKKKPVPPPAQKKVDTESPQVKAIRKAIEEYNKQ